MPLLLDTWNILHTSGVLPPDLAGIGLEGLIDLIGTSRYRMERVTAVCDGAPAPGSPTGKIRNVVVRHTGPVTADDVIVALVKRSSAPRQILVVTSDRAVAREVRKRRAQVVDSAAFLEQLATDAGRPATPEKPARRRKRGEPDPLPADIVDEAAALEEGVDRTPAPKPAPAEPPAPPLKLPGDEKHHGVVPADLLAEAEALEASLRAEIDEDRAERAAAEPPPPPRPVEPAKQKKEESILPEEILREAAALEESAPAFDPEIRSLRRPRDEDAPETPRESPADALPDWLIEEAAEIERSLR